MEMLLPPMQADAGGPKPKAWEKKEPQKLWEPSSRRSSMLTTGAYARSERLTRAQIKAWFGSWEREGATQEEVSSSSAEGGAARRPGRGQQRQAEAQADAEAGAAEGQRRRSLERGYWWHKATRCGEQQ